MTGNGRQGALCWGTAGAIRLTVCHERLFLPMRAPLPAPDTAAILPRLRDLLDRQRYAEAAAAVCERAVTDEPAYAETVWIDPLVGAATLTVRPHRPARHPDRSVDPATGLVVLRWHVERGEVRMEAFASRPADAVVVRLSTTGGFSGVLALDLIDGRPPLPVTARTHHDDAGTALTVSFGVDRPGALTGYRVHCRTLAGDVDGPRVRSDATLVLRTLLPGEEEPDLAGDFEALLGANAAVNGELMGRVRLDLAADPAARAADTPALLAGPVSPALV